MTKTHIDQATNEQLDYAAGWAQGIKSGLVGNAYNAKEYHPITDQAQCGELIDKFKINVLFKGDNICQCFIGHSNSSYHESKMIAAVKAYLWYVYPDGLIPIYKEGKS